jgi:ABC-type branched-subunit amino acid transport system substrate-binding protein
MRTFVHVAKAPTRVGVPLKRCLTEEKLVKRARWSTFLVAVCFGIVSSTAVAGGQGGDELEATELGVTADTITVTVVAAIEVPGFPGLFQGNHDGVDAWAEYVNDKGGLAGREVVVKHVDSKLSGDAARAAFRQACQDSFAIVGTGVLLLQNFDDITQCTDQAGAVTGLPDIGVTVTEPNEQCAPTTFSVNPPALDCTTRDETPQTWRVSTGPVEYLVDKFGEQKGGFLYPSDTASAKIAQVPIFRSFADLGVETAYEEDVSALAQQSAYTSIVSAMRDAGVTYVTSGLAFDSTVKLRTEAAAQGFEPELWVCSLQCYDEGLIAPENVEVVEGQYVYTPFLPFLGKGSEAKKNKMMREWLKRTEKTDGFSIQAFAAGLFLQEAIEEVTADDPNDLTRAAVLEAAANIHEFDAGGMLAPTDMGARLPADCMVLLQVKNGEFTRVFPKKKGTFACGTEATIELDQL